MGNSGQAGGDGDITKTGVFFPLCEPCWNCSALTRRIFPACPHATAAVVCYLTVRLFFNIWACLQPAPASLCLLSGPFTNAHWLRTARSVDLSWPDFKKRWLGTTPTRNPALRQGFPCSVLWFSCQALIQIRLLKWLMSDHSSKTEARSRCTVVIMCLIVSQQENTLAYTTFSVHSGITVPLLLMCWPIVSPL